ncbi:MAG: hypothetical protein HC853_14480 [Anaerolineae bacterium]|nr:hypothetical protein [Anaerolineae bacterium]
MTYPCQTQTNCSGVARPHALMSISAGPVAEYDANGNMTRRWNSVWYRHDWNADNKITTVKNGGGGVLMSISYDADGQRVKTVTECQPPCGKIPPRASP